MTEENASHLRVLCAHCKRVKEPSIYATAGPLCHRCERAAERVERILVIGGVTYRQILKAAEPKSAQETKVGGGLK